MVTVFFWFFVCFFTLQKWTSSCCLRSLLSCCTLKMCANWPPAYHTSVGGAYKSWNHRHNAWNYCRQVCVAVDAVGFAALLWSEKGIPLCLTFLSGISFFSSFYCSAHEIHISEPTRLVIHGLVKKQAIVFTNLSIFSLFFLLFFLIYIKTSMMAWKFTFSTKMWQYHCQ